MLILMKKRPFLLASLTVGAIFLFFVLVIFTAGFFRSGSSLVAVGEKVGILNLEGPIVNARQVLEQIDQFRNQTAVKAVVLRVNSPGGAVGPSQEIYSELKRFAQEKPLVVSMGSVAASGGYYVALAGERLFANPGTITGSIGVIMSFPNYQELMGKVGVETEVVKSGRFKDIGSSTRDFSAADRELLQNMIDDVHQQFVEEVSLQRNMPVERLQPFVDGRIFTGRQAQQAGLIDELGTFNDAVKFAAKLAGMGDDPDLVYPEPEKRSLLDRYLPDVISRYLGIELGAQDMIGPQYMWRVF